MIDSSVKPKSHRQLGHLRQVASQSQELAGKVEDWLVSTTSAAAWPARERASRFRDWLLWFSRGF